MLSRCSLVTTSLQRLGFPAANHRCEARVGMAEIIKLEKFSRSQNAATQPKPNPPKARTRQKGSRWPAFTTRITSMPLATELTRDTVPPTSRGPNAILESGVLAFRRETNGEPQVLLISKKRSKRWGIPKGRAEPHLSLPENAAKEAFEEAGVIGYVAPSSVGMYRATKTVPNSSTKRVIEVWVYLLEVTETLPDWPEREKRAIRWVTCEAAAQHLREPVLAHLCHRLAQS
jgi:8-oxo-dGTP pyrophosphatase MutT (NUDIX family)